MFIPYKVDVPMQRWPLANFALILGTSAISIYFFATGMEDNPAFDYFLLQPDQFKFTQLVGSALVHADIIHLLGNMLFLWTFGNAVNAKMGHLGYLGLYFGTAIFASIIWCFFGPHASILGIALPMRASALGASGAIMGVIGAFLVLYPRNDVSIGYFFLLRLGTLEASAYWVIGTYIVLDLWGMLQAAQGVGYLAHVAGTAFGFAATFGAVYWGFFAPDPYEENLLQLWSVRPRGDRAVAQKQVARYLIEARDPASGFRTQLKVVAQSQLEARNQAVKEGLAVDRITQIP